MFIQTETTPNPNSLKFLPGKKVSKIGIIEITKKDETNNELIKDILSINGETKINLVFKYKDNTVQYSLKNLRKFDLELLKSLKAKEYVEKISV